MILQKMDRLKTLHMFKSLLIRTRTLGRLMCWGVYKECLCIEAFLRCLCLPKCIKYNWSLWETLHFKGFSSIRRFASELQHEQPLTSSKQLNLQLTACTLHNEDTPLPIFIDSMIVGFLQSLDAFNVLAMTQAMRKESDYMLLAR